MLENVYVVLLLRGFFFGLLEQQLQLSNCQLSVDLCLVGYLFGRNTESQSSDSLLQIDWVWGACDDQSCPCITT